jgi:hypothetical protein
MIIHLPFNRVIGLRLRMREYTARLTMTSSTRELQYKYCLLQDLFSQGWVNTTKVFLEHYEEEKFDRVAFVKAVKIIQDCCETGGLRTDRPVQPEGIAEAVLNQKPLPVPVEMMN